MCIWRDYVDEKQEPQLMALLAELVKQFLTMTPRLRKDGICDPA